MARGKRFKLFGRKSSQVEAPALRQIQAPKPAQLPAPVTKRYNKGDIVRITNLPLLLEEIEDFWMESEDIAKTVKDLIKKDTPFIEAEIVGITAGYRVHEEDPQYDVKCSTFLKGTDQETIPINASWFEDINDVDPENQKDLQNLMDKYDERLLKDSRDQIRHVNEMLAALDQMEGREHEKNSALSLLDNYLSFGKTANALDTPELRGVEAVTQQVQELQNRQKELAQEIQDTHKVILEARLAYLKIDAEFTEENFSDKNIAVKGLGEAVKEVYKKD